LAKLRKIWEMMSVVAIVQAQGAGEFGSKTLLPVVVDSFIAVDVLGGVARNVATCRS
jgi:hypothetical protein